MAAPIDFLGAARSQRVEVDGKARFFPTRKDYVDWLVDGGHISSSQEFPQHTDLVQAVYRHWQRQGQIACKFARLIARNPAHHGVAATIIETGGDGALGGAATTHLERSFKAACTKPEVQALTLLFPYVESGPALVRLIRDLRALPAWEVTGFPNPSDRHERVYVRITASIEDGVVAEVLGFGPFDFLPATRRAPIAALELRTKAPGAKGSSGPGRPRRVHLAAIELGWTEAQVRKVWGETEQARLAVLGGDDSAAKAKVAFSIPLAIWATR